MFLRLRQICLVAQDLAQLRDTLAGVFGLSPCHADPRIAEFGLENVLIPIGSSFIEIVSPIRAGTTADRYLDRRGGDGGYMTIFQSNVIEPWRSHIASINVREAAFLEYEGFNAIQMHPRDTGGPLLEINRTEGGEALSGAYFPAGEGWREHVRTNRVRGITGAEIQASDPQALAARWAGILKRDAPVRDGEAWQIAVDNAIILFVNDGDGRGEGLSGVYLDASDPAAVVAAARDRGLHTGDDMVRIGGVRFHLTQMEG